MSKILLAEDDTDMRRFLVKALQNAGFDVASFDNGMSAYHRLREEPYEMLLTDIVMPEMDGIELARRAAELQPEVRKLLVKDLRALNVEFFKAGKTSPVDPSRLYDADERFHRRVVEAGEGPRLIALHDAVKPQAERSLRMYISMLTGDIRSSVE